MLLKDWLPTVLTCLGGLVLFLLGKLWEGRGKRSEAAKSYNDKVFSEMVTLFDELKEKAKDAEASAREAQASSAAVLKDSQEKVAAAQAMVTDAHKTVSEAQAAASAAQRSAMEAQQMVSAGLAREAEVNRQLKAAWEKVDALDSRVRDMERVNAAMVGGAIQLDPRRVVKATQIEIQEEN